MSTNDIHLLDLPNEILITILKKLDNVEVLDSLFEIHNYHLHELIQSNLFTNTLDLSTKSSNDILDRFCQRILPKISSNINYLIIESSTIERLLLAASYSNLTKLKISNFQQEFISKINSSPIRNICQNQITDLVLINTDKHNRIQSLKTYTTSVYELILNYFQQLKSLTVIPSLTNDYPPLSFGDSVTNRFSSSNLTQLSIDLCCFNDCLRLLDGRFEHLSILNVKIASINSFSSINYENPIKLKSFSFTCYDMANEYDNQIIPLIRRMFDLEKLTLYLRVRNRSQFIDGTHLHHDILVHLPRLHSFLFYISTVNALDGFVRYITDENLQRTFTNLGYRQVTCFVNYFRSYKAISHVFSLPFQFDRLEKIANRFPSMIFHHVTYVKVYDIIPFKHEFFHRITQAFPLLRNLCVMNYMPQPKDNPREIPVKYLHLTCLDLKCVHTDYIEQFLMDEYTCVPCLVELKLSYEQLKIVTNNFTRESTRKNCTNVKRLITEDTLMYSNEVYAYFPSIEK